ncbi:hypothetical protein C8R41DRAFT_904346 [Lentinula lateritia]|uniref:Uncharacterized protein n=1 Tax=Lentinula lateritia TaxID=40482 RepID=A0ABQ8V8V7_9AGAR|nr:hypothetical protein C8R41DRAFT_904346 [Lentinula lateritia]
MDIPDEEIYNPCPRPNPAKSVSNVRTACFIFSNLLSTSGLNLKTSRNVPRKRCFPKNTASTFDVGGLSLDTSNPGNYSTGLVIQDFIDYHQRHQLPRPPPMDNRASLWHYIMDDVIEDLSAHCRFKLQRILPLSPKYDYTIALYNSHHISITELEDDEEEDVIRIIKERFGEYLAAERPQWFFLLMDSIH